VNNLSQDSLALIALTNRLQPTGVPPLKAPEAWRLLEKVHEPSALLGLDSQTIAELTGLPTIEAERVQRLLDTGVVLALTLESIMETGIVPVTAVDDSYPYRLRDRLDGSAPPVLYCAGEVSLLGSDAIGVVGSREVSPDGVEVARSIAYAVASAGVPLVSGGAKGVDRISMGAALERGGTVVGILADSLEEAISRSDNRRIVLEGVACLCTPYSPNARFTAGNAMGRNKIIYGLSSVTVVVASSKGEGGTWAGATEAIKKRFGRVAVWVGPGEGPGNEPLVRAGGIPIDNAEAVVGLGPLPVEGEAPDQMRLSFGGGGPAEPRPEPVGSLRDKAPLADALSSGMRSSTEVPAPPPDAWTPKPTGTCWCGCGKEVEEVRFFVSRHAAGAAQRAVVKHFGSVEAFLCMFGEVPGSAEASEDGAGTEDP
jgi:predicted Rossmann fold nucleotide-binding protein DprA/Smf involved in DNA uptake